MCIVHLFSNFYKKLGWIEAALFEPVNMQKLVLIQKSQHFTLNEQVLPLLYN